MKKSTILATLEQNKTTLLDEYTTLSENFSQKAIRNMRVSLKQWKTFALFIARIKEETPLQLPEQIKIFYKSAGAIRARHISKKKIHGLVFKPDNAMIAAFENYCTLQEELSIDQFNRDLTDAHEHFGVLFDNLEKKYVKESSESLKKQYILYKQSVYSKIYAIAHKKQCTDCDLHDIRKEIKHLLYLGTQCTDKQLQRYNKFSKILGRWNDHIDLSKTLKNYGKNTPAAKKRVKKTRKALKKIILQEKKLILKQLKNHFY